ncbi:MAG TPA: hypothetical protein VG013_14890 [Gemmataceae bacterium]|nr:hypothetical protein [Gemmataceae bacterium]
MRALLAKLATQKVLGIYVGEQVVTVSGVAATPFGPIEFARQHAPYEAEQLPAVLDRLVASVAGGRKRRRLRVALGIPAQRVFFSTRPIRTADTDAPPEVLLHEVLQSPSLCIDDMVVDVVKAQPGKRRVASIVSTRKKYLAGLLAALEGCGVHAWCAEPAPCALLRAAARRRRAPRRARTVLRVFLGQGQGLAVVGTASLPLIWRSFALPAADEASALCSVARSLQTLLVHCGTEAAIDVAMVHGRPDLRGRLEEQGLAGKLGVRLLWSDGPGLDDGDVAFGLGLGCLEPQPGTFDLARSLKPRPALWDIFPCGELAVQMALLLCMGLFLNFHHEKVEESCRSVEAESRRHPWLDAVPDAQLEKDKKDLEQRVEAVKRFLGDRVIWTSYTQDVARRLPEKAALSSFQGVCELALARVPKVPAAEPKKSLVLCVAAPTAGQGSVPKEIDRFLRALRDQPLLQRDFPLVKLADIKWSKPLPGRSPAASFTVICLPGIGSRAMPAADIRAPGKKAGS